MCLCWHVQFKNYSKQEISIFFHCVTRFYLCSLPSRSSTLAMQGAGLPACRTNGRSQLWSLVPRSPRTPSTLRWEGLSDAITPLIDLNFGSSFVVLKCFLCSRQDEDEFPDLASGGAAQRCTKAESTSAQTHAQPKLPKNLVRECAVWLVLSMRVLTEWGYNINTCTKPW